MANAFVRPGFPAEDSGPVVAIRTGSNTESEKPQRRDVQEARSCHQPLLSRLRVPWCSQLVAGQRVQTSGLADRFQGLPGGTQEGVGVRRARRKGVMEALETEPRKHLVLPGKRESDPLNY